MRLLSFSTTLMLPSYHWASRRQRRPNLRREFLGPNHTRLTLPQEPPRTTLSIRFASNLGDPDLYNIGTVRYIRYDYNRLPGKILMCQRRPCGPLQGRRCPRNVGLLTGSLGQIRRRLSSGNLDLRQGHHGIRSLAVDGEV